MPSGGSSQVTDFYAKLSFFSSEYLTAPRWFVIGKGPTQLRTGQLLKTMEEAIEKIDKLEHANAALKRILIRGHRDRGGSV